MHRMFICSLLITTALFLPVTSYAHAGEIPPEAQTVLQRLTKESKGTLDIRWNEETATPARMTGSLTAPSRHTPEWIAFTFLNSTKALYGLNRPYHEVKLAKVERPLPDTVQLHFQHLLFNTPVWGDGLVVEIDSSGVVRQVKGTIHPNLAKQLFNRPMHAALTPQQAVDKVLAASRSRQPFVRQPEVASYYLPTEKGTPLVYVVTLHTDEADSGSKQVLVHSLSGRIIE